MSDFTLYDLEKIIEAKASGDPQTSWTAKLVHGGQRKAAKKLGEEAVESVIAAIAQDKQNLTEEAADLLYHLLVVLHIGGISLGEVMAVLEKRTAQSGLEEKAARACPV